MIIIKTKMTEIPKNCKECEIKVIAPGMIMCPVLHDWIEPFEFQNGKVKLDKCPLVMENNNA